MASHGSGAAPDGGTDLYDLLGLAPGASDEAIRAAVTEQRRTWRRRTASPDIAVRQEAERRMQRLDDAERTLLDPTRRSAYNAALPDAYYVETERPSGEAEAGAGAGAGGAADTAQPWLVRALEQIDKEQYEVATFTARRAVDADPENFFAWSILGEAAARAGDGWVAKDAIERALSLRPEDAKLHAMRGWILGLFDDLPRAVSAYRTAARLDPSQPDYRVRAVRALLDQGSVDEAVTEAEAAYQADPDDGESRTVLAEALSERAEAAQHELPDGRLLITTPGQASYVEALCNRGLSVQSPDPLVNEVLRRQREDARRARRRRFSLPALRRNYKVPAGLGALTLAFGCCAYSEGAGGSMQVVYVLTGMAIALAFVGAVLLTCFEPEFTRNAEAIEHTVPRRRGRGPGDPRPGDTRRGSGR